MFFYLILLLDIFTFERSGLFSHIPSFTLHRPLIHPLHKGLVADTVVFFLPYNGNVRKPLTLGFCPWSGRAGCGLKVHVAVVLPRDAFASVQDRIVEGLPLHQKVGYFLPSDVPVRVCTIQNYVTYTHCGTGPDRMWREVRKWTDASISSQHLMLHNRYCL